MIKNWRGQEIHPADAWDHWTNSQKEYEKLKAVYDTIAKSVDHKTIEVFADMVARFEAAEYAELMAGEDI